VRAFTRRPNAPAAAALVNLGATVVGGDFQDPVSLAQAARNVDAAFVMSTRSDRGETVETNEGITVVRAAKAAGVRHLVYSSVAGADRATGIPHFDSKYAIELAIRESGIPFTIIAPVFLMENYLAGRLAAELSQGFISMALPATRRLQQVSAADIARFATLVIERRTEFVGKRLEIASDELTGSSVAATLSEILGHRIEYIEASVDRLRQSNHGLATMYEWFDRVGYDADVVKLWWLYPEIRWQRFANWAWEQEWRETLAPAYA
jgi:uncharacterized protein YbjT (DUF2867 family)